MSASFRPSLLAAAATVAVGAGFAAPAAACSDSPYMGATCFFAGNFCPVGYLPADGRLMPIQQNQALYSILGTSYGGDGKTNFALPDLRGRGPIGVGTGPGLATVGLGQALGNAQVTLTANNIPPHVHSATFSGGSIAGKTTGNLTLPVTGSVTGITVTSAPSLTAKTSGTLTLANTAGSGNNIPSAGNVFTSAGTGAKVYGTASGSDFALGGTQTFTGPVTGSITNTVSNGTLSGNASGPASLTVAGTASGSVVVGPNQTALTAVPTRGPSLVLTACIADYGTYPTRP